MATTTTTTRPFLDIARECYQNLVGDPGDRPLTELLRETGDQVGVHDGDLRERVTAIAAAIGVSIHREPLAAAAAPTPAATGGAVGSADLHVVVRVREGARDIVPRRLLTVERGTTALGLAQLACQDTGLAADEWARMKHLPATATAFPINDERTSSGFDLTMGGTLDFPVDSGFARIVVRFEAPERPRVTPRREANAVSIARARRASPARRA